MVHEALPCPFVGLLVGELFGGFVAAAVDPGDFFRFVQSKNDIAELFVVVTGLFPDLRDADSTAAFCDDFQDPFRSVLGGLAGVSGGCPPVSGGKRPDEFFQAVEPPVEIVDIPFGGNVVIVHEKLDHRIEAYRFAFSLCHPFLQGDHRCGTLLLSRLPTLDNAIGNRDLF
jgi:hypothetical protein